MNSTPKFPPGPWKLPLIGNLHQLVDSLPHDSLMNLAKKYGPLMHLQLGEVAHIVVSSPEIAKEVMKTHDTIFANRPFLIAARILSYDCTNIGFSPYGDYWRHVRKICAMDLLSTHRVQFLRSIREEEMANLIDALYLSESSPTNLSEKISLLSHSITARAAFGKKSKHEREFILLSKEVSKVAAGFCVADIYPSIKMLQLISRLKRNLEKLHQDINRILGNIIEDHRENKMRMKTDDGKEKEDIVDVLLKLQKCSDLDQPLTDRNIKAVLLAST
ncbi:Cytochrome P450, E-class, group I [Parasponia andersonii]|uniref:Cytochrome P450, E-class, group I n=1 Tax=Parasponia andersonii TaxID=3476 RepID=A0A2P5B3R6_PARAD|nr:Cytochrome P450, E-class, group I [Parasponia andersonii]